MNLSDSITLEGYIRQAETYGTEEVFETALDGGLNLWDLGRLALRLQNIEPKWRLTPEAQELFVVALVRWQGVDIKGASRMAGCTPTIARTWVYSNDTDDPDYTPDSALRAASKARFESLKGIVRGWHRTG